MQRSYKTSMKFIPIYFLLLQMVFTIVLSQIPILKKKNTPSKPIPAWRNIDFCILTLYNSPKGLAAFWFLMIFYINTYATAVQLSSLARSCPTL